MASTTLFTLYNYWDSGLAEMPTVLRYIYEHNCRMAAKHRIPFILLTRDNISTYVQVPPSFCALSPVHQSDVARFLVLHETGGIWLDSDVIVIGDLASAYSDFLSTDKEAQLDAEFDSNDYLHRVDGDMLIFHAARAKRARFVGTAKIGSASLFFRSRTTCSAFCRDYVLDKVKKQRTFEWAELGPDNVTALYRMYPERIGLNSPTVVRNGCNFNNWIDCRSPSNERWLKDTEAAARRRASEVASNCCYVITWNLHQRYQSSDEALAALFEEPRSVFRHLIDQAIRAT